jgi:ParB/RepB/Spo0J family partition protein
MQDSSAFQFIAIDQIHESTTNPRLTFDQTKLEELAESIRQHGLIQSVTVRPNANGFEIVAGARRFRASQFAELFSISARIVELDDAAVMEWQFVKILNFGRAFLRRSAGISTLARHARLRHGRACLEVGEVGPTGSLV